MRILACIAVVAGLGLGGCNVVVTDLPMFTVADEAGAPPLRPGIWLKTKPDCQFDATAALKDLPECADPMIIRAHHLVDPAKEDAAIPYVMAAGDPRVVQIMSADKPLQGYYYGGVKPLKTDPEGRIIEARTWMTQCGPPPAASKTVGEAKDYLTDSPLPGLVLDEKTGNCKPKTVAALRGATAASEAWAEEPSVIRWLRDGEE